MAFFFGDGFDLYALPADATLNYWDPVSLNPASSSLIAGRFPISRAWNFSNSSTLVKASNVNDAVHHFVVAYNQTFAPSGSSNGFYIQLFDGTTAQCSVVFRTDGSIQLVAGGPTSGTVLAQYVGAVNAANTWFAFEIEVVINNTTGSFAVRKNGNTTNDFFLGSLNTRTSANNYANKLQLGSLVGSTLYIDDFLWRSDAASVPWVGDIRCYTRMPVSDVAIQFSRTSTPITSLLWSPIGVGNSFAANSAYYFKFVSNYNGFLTAALFTLLGGGTGHVKAALFDSNAGGGIGNVLAISNEVTNPSASPLTCTFASPVRVTQGVPYWIGLNNDSGSIAFNVISVSSLTPTPAVIVLTNSFYTSWPTGNPGGVTVVTNVPGISVVYSPQANADCVSELQQDGTASYVAGAGNGQADLYAIGALNITPTLIVGVTTRGLFQKSDAGTRNATVQLKSGTTTVQGVSTPLPTTWGWLARNDLVDPATGLAWTAAGLNAATIGPVVTA
jgi:hypothetical protein